MQLFVAKIEFERLVLLLGKRQLSKYKFTTSLFKYGTFDRIVLKD